MNFNQEKLKEMVFLAQSIDDLEYLGEIVEPITFEEYFRNYARPDGYPLPTLVWYRGDRNWTHQPFGNGYSDRDIDYMEQWEKAMTVTNFKRLVDLNPAKYSA